MKTIILFFLLLSTATHAQVGENPDIRKTNFGWKLQDRRLNWSALQRELLTVPSTKPFVKKARTSYMISGIAVISAAGFLLADRFEKTEKRNGINGYQAGALATFTVATVCSIRAYRSQKKPYVCIMNISDHATPCRFYACFIRHHFPPVNCF